MHRAWSAPGVVIAGLAAALACGASPQEGSASAEDDAGAASAPGDARDDGSSPVRAQFGLDVRPPNTTCRAPVRLTSPTSIKVTPVFSGLTFEGPVALLQAPGDSSKWYVVEQGESGAADAKVVAFDNNQGVTQADLSDFLVLPTAEIQTGLPDNEGGLLGFAFHPDYAANGTAFLSYTVHSATSPIDMRAIVTRIRRRVGLNQLDRATEEVLTAPDGRTLAIDKLYVLHNNAHMAFGLDGMLYIAFGDGGDPNGVMGQNQATIFGKILRIDVGPTGRYRIPPSNPFVGQAGKRGETWAFGFRNPWRFSIDRLSGDLFAGDVGDDRYEELDKVVKGGNYGYPILEGMHCYGGEPTCDTTGLTPPVVEYPHVSGNLAIVGGYVYRGANIPGLRGSYLFADHVSGRIWRLVYDAGTGAASTEELAVAGFQISSFGEGADGELYVLAYTTGKIYRIDPDGTKAGAPFPQTLSATGCVDPKDAKRPATAMIPYDVNSPLWSDATDKRRWMALPDGKKITVAADGDFDFPNGTVLMKELSLAGTKVETRLFIHHDDGEWAGYGYEWNDAQTDASLLPGSKTKHVASQEWTYPGRTECLQCHTQAAGRSLGLEVAQLNGEVLYPATNRISNQLATLDHIGMFTGPIGDPAKLARFARLAGAEPVAERARAYVHSNCSHCHRPAGGTSTSMDLRFATSFVNARICNVAPEVGDLAIAGAMLFLPGDPDRSLLSRRVHATDAPRMPPLARALLDVDGSRAIDDWIRSVAVCP